MKAQRNIQFVDTNIIPARNAGIGSLLWDLQNYQDPGSNGTFLLGPEFAFIDVGVSRARVSTILKTHLTRELGMDVNYVATELFDVVPYANVTLAGERADNIREYLSGMISCNENVREIIDWHYVVNHEGKVSSLAYSYSHHGNEVWEAYYMGRNFMVSGDKIEFHDPILDELLAPDVKKIEAIIDLEKKQDSNPDQSSPSTDGYIIEKNPLEAGLLEFGIPLQKTDIPQRIDGNQNVLFLGNVLNHYPLDEQTRELDRIATNMKDGDIVIVQKDDPNAGFIEVFKVKGQGTQKTFERAIWINTNKLEVHKLVNRHGSWRQIHVKPELDRIVNRLIECLGRKIVSPTCNQKDRRIIIHQKINLFFNTFFRALPVEETLRIAIRKALQRLPSEAGLAGIPIFKGDVKDVYGGALGLDLSPIVPEEDFIYMMMPANLVEVRVGKSINSAFQHKEHPETCTERS